jgi:signal transduction histidine kinase/integral membrane sensor domain MASE1/ActR/RegA family two-component response regulator
VLIRKNLPRWQVFSLGADPNEERFVPTLLLIPTVAVLYFGAARLGLSLASVAPQVTVVWPPTGIALVAVFLFGAPAFYGVWVGAFLANAIANEPWLTAASVAAGNTLEAVAGAWLLRQAAFRPTLERLRDVVALMAFGVLISPIISATIGVTSLCLGGVQPCTAAGRIWGVWWLGDAMGALVVAPLLFVWVSIWRARPYGRPTLRFLAFCGAVGVLSWLVFAGPVGREFPHYPFHYALVPIMIGAAVGYGPLGTTTVMAIASGIAIVGALSGIGRFAGGDIGQELVLLQLFLGMVASSGLTLAAAISAGVDESRRRDADYAATRALAESSRLDLAAPRILQAVCESLRWDLGALWVLDEHEHVLRCVELWHVPWRRFPGFEASSRGRTFAHGIGLPGRVWATEEPAWIPDVVVDQNFPRAPAAAQEGLHAAFAFPIRVAPRVLGVLEFFSVTLQRPDSSLLARMGALGSQIGQFMERQRAEDERRRAETQRESLLVKEQEARIQAQAVAQIGRDLTQSLEPEIVGQRIVESVCQLLQGWVAVLYAIESTTGDLVAVARAGRTAPRLGDDYRLTHGAGLVGLAIRERRPVVTTDLLSDDRIRYTPEERAEIELAGHRAACALPLVANGEVIGALGIGDEVGRIFDERAITLAETFADFAALAFHNARSFARVQASRVEAETANRAKDEFLSMLGHELRNPLGAVVNAISLLNLTAPDESTARPREIMSRQMAHLTRLVDDLLDVGRLTSGRLELQRTVVDFGVLVDQCVTALSAQAPTHDVRVATSPILVEGDPARLQQIVTNLFDNAVKFTPAGGNIRVEVFQDDNHAVLRIRDSGIGIGPDLLPHIFDLFTQGEHSLDRLRGGLGLGLAVVQRLVSLHGGQVSAKSGGPEQGSEFVVQLPIADAVSAPTPAMESLPTPRSYRVLVVEDDEDARESLRLLLGAEGHTVRVAGDGIEGLEILRMWRPDVALVDIGLPGLDGYAFARAVGADPEVGQTPLVALTGYGQPEDRRRTAEAGFRAHLVKPVFQKALLCTLGSVMDKERERH